jgi:hypothetical protein
MSSVSADILLVPTDTARTRPAGGGARRRGLARHTALLADTNTSPTRFFLLLFLLTPRELAAQGAPALCRFAERHDMRCLTCSVCIHAADILAPRELDSQGASAWPQLLVYAALSY